MTEQAADNVALFDMDGTLCDYEAQLAKDLMKLQAPGEPVFDFKARDQDAHIEQRKDMLMSSEGWWRNLPRFQLGWDVLKIAQAQGYRVMILTQGPRRHPAAWSGKKQWIDANLGPDVDVTITRDKGLVYGKILVDDFPPYAERWLRWRKNGLVIMPANEGNKEYKHLQVVRYDGTNLDEVRQAMALRLKKTVGLAELHRKPVPPKPVKVR